MGEKRFMVPMSEQEIDQLELSLPSTLENIGLRSRIQLLRRFEGFFDAKVFRVDAGFESDSPATDWVVDFIEARPDFPLPFVVVDRPARPGLIITRDLRFLYEQEDGS